MSEKKESFYEQHKEAIKREMELMVPLFTELADEDHMRLIKNLHKTVDSILISADMKNNSSCAGAGCSSCCHAIIYGSRLEMDYIAVEAEKLGATPNKERAEKQNNMIDQHGSNLTWMEKACPYLSDGEVRSCTIYDIRPMICRAHNSIEDPVKCDKEGADGMEIQGITIAEGRIINLEAIMMSVISASEEVHDKLELVGINETVRL